MKEYTIVVNGKPEGPYSIDELKGLKIRPETFIRKPGMDDYKEAHELVELREMLGFKFQQTAPQYFASFDQRLMASAIDYFFLLVGYVIIVLFIYIFIDQKMFRIGTAVIFLLLVPVAKFIYSSIAEASIKQATIGKRLMDIKVGDLFGNRLDIGTSILRNFAKILSTLPLFIGYLYCFMNKKQQCLHDVMANTLVVKQRLL
ncbi:RDD family protein [Pedobacter cryotolerans]|uniref:RDD family protein n=1 Tax=Pedobacter cryotolerans TaxID=2571270 RepID=A0A4V5NXC1_9SPHI|nr:RDD family protein [Pedobacter cryotolerans]TKB97432.1 RDD family protein [Pedobacter cryotolerans]